MTPYQPTHTPTAALVLANGEVFYGDGIGHIGSAVGEVCFNTAMTGYQEILTDPSYALKSYALPFPMLETPARRLRMKKQAARALKQRPLAEFLEPLSQQRLIGALIRNWVIGWRRGKLSACPALILAR